MSAASTTSRPNLRYRRYRRPFDPRWRFITGFSPPPRRILDVGCGPGSTLDQFADIYPDVERYGVDRLDQGPDSVVYHRMDLDQEPLPFPSSHFDVVIMTHVIEHLCHPTLIAREIGRVLMPGGWFYIEAPNWTAAVTPWPNFWDDPTHVRPWSRNGFHSLLTDYAGLRVEVAGNRRSWPHVPRDLAKLFVGTITGKISNAGSEASNLLGWCVFSIGQKPNEIDGAGPSTGVSQRVAVGH
jgi:SAM-dependent methyltransferase